MAKKETKLIKKVEQTTLDNFYALAEEIKTLTKSIINNQWEIAKRLKYINDNWKEYRKNKDFPYTKFEDFIQDYYNWTKQHAYRFIDAEEVRILLEDKNSNTGVTFPNVEISVADKLYDLYKLDDERTVTFLENNPKPTRRQIEQEIKALRYENIRDIPLPEGKYNVIYADPPWNYNDIQDTPNLGGAKKHYPTMTIKQLCNLDIQSLCVDDAILFLWVTSPLLEECFEVINSWGFTYKASFIWDKIKHNMGHYNSVRHEFLLLCTKGSFTPENMKLFDSVVSVEKTNKHSKKPEIFYEMIETLYPSGKKIELFARKTRKGWESWGNEI